MNNTFGIAGGCASRPLLARARCQTRRRAPHAGVEQWTHYFKSIEDAHAFRRNVLQCFERAALPDTSEAVRQAAVPCTAHCTLCRTSEGPPRPADARAAAVFRGDRCVARWCRLGSMWRQAGIERPCLGVRRRAHRGRGRGRAARHGHGRHAQDLPRPDQARPNTHHRAAGVPDPCQLQGAFLQHLLTGTAAACRTTCCPPTTVPSRTTLQTCSPGRSFKARPTVL